VLRIGLTGGIASGKSTVAAMFSELGVCIVDTDIIARELVAPGTPALAEVVAAFGPGILDPGGTLDRRLMRRIVFSDADRRQRLEAILHPRIRETARARSADCPGPYAILVVPLLFESGFDRLVERTIVVDCPETLQIERLMARDEATLGDARAIVEAQMARTERRARADDIIDSGTTLGATRERVAALHASYLTLAENCPGTQGRAE
jgi:dephospho-CoA kinase